MAARYAVGVILCEAEAARIEIAAEHLREPDFVNWAIAAIEAVDTGRVDIQPDDLVSEVRECDRIAETDIAAATDHTDRLHSHRSSSSSSSGAAFTLADGSCATASKAVTISLRRKNWRISCQRSGSAWPSCNSRSENWMSPRARCSVMNSVESSSAR